MTDPYDTRAHWLAFEIATRRSVTWRMRQLDRALYRALRSTARAVNELFARKAG